MITSITDFKYLGIKKTGIGSNSHATVQVERWWGLFSEPTTEEVYLEFAFWKWLGSGKYTPDEVVEGLARNYQLETGEQFKHISRGPWL